jgi:hypothetical protein
LPEELPRWVNGANGPLPGLVRRRDAEIKLAATPPQKAPEGGSGGGANGETNTTPQAPSGAAEVNLLDFFKYFVGEPKEPQQTKGVELLVEELREVAPELLSSDAYWVKEYRGQNGPPKPPPPANGITKLPVRYQCQIDSEYLGGKDALRMCFSSSCAMLLDYIDPTALRGHGQEDDYYLETLNRLGYDSTDAAGQIATLKHFGLDATFRTNGNLNKIRELLAQDIPVPCGILHHCAYNAACGGGHWMTIVGIDEQSQEVIAHDPYGRLDQINGNYLATDCDSGKFVRYKFKYWLPRWEVVGGDGWMIEAHP